MSEKILVRLLRGTRGNVEYMHEDRDKAVSRAEVLAGLHGTSIVEIPEGYQIDGSKMYTRACELVDGPVDDKNPPRRIMATIRPEATEEDVPPTVRKPPPVPGWRND